MNGNQRYRPLNISVFVGRADACGSQQQIQDGSTDEHHLRPHKEHTCPSDHSLLTSQWQMILGVQNSSFKIPLQMIGGMQPKFMNG